MGKREADNYLTSENVHEQDDEDETPSGTFQQASAETLRNRVIKAPKSRLSRQPGAAAGSGTPKSVFGGFSFTNPAPSAAPSPFAAPQTSTGDGAGKNDSTPLPKSSTIFGQTGSAFSFGTPSLPASDKAPGPAPFSFLNPSSQSSQPPTTSAPTPFAGFTPTTSANSSAASAFAFGASAVPTFNTLSKPSIPSSTSTPSISSFGGFAFGKPNPTEAAESKGETEDMDVSSTPPDTGTVPITEDQPNAKSAKEDVGNADRKREVKLLAKKLAGLNNSVQRALAKGYGEDKFSDMSPVFEMYKKHRETILSDHRNLIDFLNAKTGKSLSESLKSNEDGTDIGALATKGKAPEALVPSTSFGQPNSGSVSVPNPVSSFTLPSAPAPSAAPAFDLGGATTTLSASAPKLTSASGFSFGSATQPVTAPTSGSAFSATTTSSPFSFDPATKESTTAIASKPASFSFTSNQPSAVSTSGADSKPTFAFGTTPAFGGTSPASNDAKAPPSSAFGSSSNDSKPLLFSLKASTPDNKAGLFSIPNASSDAKPSLSVFGSTATESKPTFAFGSTGGDSKSPGAFTFGTSPKAPGSSSLGFTFGSPPSTASTSTSGRDAKPAPFSFGGGSAGGSAAFGFGMAPAPPPFSFVRPALNTAGSSAEDGKDNEDGGDGDDAAPPEEQIGDTLMKGAGEEEEDTVYEVRAKLSKREGDKWPVVGLGQLKLNKNRTTGKVRFLFRAEASGRLLLNSATYPELKPAVQMAGKQANVTFMAANDAGKLTMFAAKVKTGEDGNALLDAILKSKA
ncbi:hypothetical protein HK097_008584 [Rhizophlyctis rosea]|uniref:RanBD1 domain-containing protein n=1 Tax=Rhizophlyctis rosea TaxID=64517 RepID=A0AAD5SI61_9FUNG|nr:hypothetical protein HK097_008584 [Rhizophlyctis rosea]